MLADTGFYYASNDGRPFSNVFSIYDKEELSVNIILSKCKLKMSLLRSITNNFNWNT